jgi:hypothetical protein
MNENLRSCMFNHLAAGNFRHSSVGPHYPLSPEEVKRNAWRQALHRLKAKEAQCRKELKSR